MTYKLIMFVSISRSQAFDVYIVLLPSLKDFKSIQLIKVDVNCAHLVYIIRAPSDSRVLNYDIIETMISALNGVSFPSLNCYVITQR